MYAIIKAAGKQYKVQEGDLFKVDHLSAVAQGNEIDLKEVLLIQDGDDLKVGQPYVDGASVKLVVVRHLRGDKIRVVRFKRRQGYKKTKGFRHEYTELKVEKINK
ncbi:50S ribosomal protein L21 [bacterium]|nr:50S ribosomal protein L21 [bacterium]